MKNAPKFWDQACKRIKHQTRWVSNLLFSNHWLTTKSKSQRSSL